LEIPSDYYIYELGNRSIFKQFGEKTPFTIETQAFRLGSKSVQREKSDAMGLGTRKSRLLPHNSG
jgi:hypothetical protein